MAALGLARAPAGQSRAISWTRAGDLQPPAHGHTRLLARADSGTPDRILSGWLDAAGGRSTRLILESGVREYATERAERLVAAVPWEHPAGPRSRGQGTVLPSVGETEIDDGRSRFRPIRGRRLI